MWGEGERAEGMLVVLELVRGSFAGPRGSHWRHVVVYTELSFGLTCLVVM